MVTPGAPTPPLPPPPPVVAAQTIVFTSTPPANAVAGLATYVVSAKASSGLPVTFAIDASSLGACAISGATVVFVGVGTCTIDADQSGNASYQPAPQARQSFTIGSGVVTRSLQTINFGSTPPTGATVGAWYIVVATASSGLPVALWVDAASAGTCTVFGNSVHFVGTGICTVQAGQAGNANYDSAPVVQQSFAIGLTFQTIGFSSVPPVGAVVGVTTYTVTAAATSGLPVVFSPDPGSASVCTVSGSTVTPVGAGICTIDANQFGNSAFQAAPQVQQSFAVGGGAPSLSVQSINFTSAVPSSAAIGSSYGVTATASSGLPVAFSADASSAGVCTVSGSTASFVGVGTCTVDANQPGNGSYLPAPQVQQSFAVGKAPQTISFTSTPPGGSVVGGTYVVSAAASSGLPATFSADATSAGVCTVSGATVSFVGAGTCVVDADQPGDATFNAAAQVQQSLTVSTPSLSVQTITFTSSPPAAATSGGAPYAVSASASSGLAVVFSADATSAGVCTVSGSSVSLVGSGTCTIDANQPGNGSYQAAPQVQQSFAVGLAAQTIAFTSTPPSPAGIGDPDYAVAAAATSGLAVVFSVDPASAGICTVSGASVSLVGAGTCIIDADQPGDGTHQPAPRAQQSFSIASPPAPSVQSISFTSTAPAGAAAGGASYGVTATASSGLPVVFSADASSAGVCTVSGSTVSLVGAGACTVDANQPGNGSYQAAPQVQQTFAVGKATQTIGFTSTPPAGPYPGAPTYTVTATASSGLPVAFSLSPGSAGVCTISGATISFVGGGTCTINANQAGNGSYQPAPQAQQSFTVAAGAPSRSPQTITITSSSPAGSVVGGSYTITATTSSGLAVVFSADATSAGICTVSGSTVSFTGQGSCRVNADQPGNSNYLPAPQQHQSFPIGLAQQNITFTSTPPGSAVVGGATYAITATATSGLAVVFSADPASSSICTVSGSTVTPIGAGQCKVRANQPGNGAYNPAPQVEQTFTIGKGSQTVTFTWTPPPNIHKNDGPFTITATATSGLAVVFSIDPSSSGVCSVSGSTLSILAKGSCVIYANQPGNADWLPAPQAQLTVTVK